MDSLPTPLENDVIASPSNPGLLRFLVLAAIGTLAWWLVYRNLAAPLGSPMGFCR